MNGYIVDANIIGHQSYEENKNTDFGKVENNKHPSAEGDQHTVKNKVKEDLQKMWQRVRLLQITEREKLKKNK